MRLYFSLCALHRCTCKHQEIKLNPIEIRRTEIEEERERDLQFAYFSLGRSVFRAKIRRYRRGCDAIEDERSSFAIFIDALVHGNRDTRSSYGRRDGARELPEVIVSRCRAAAGTHGALRRSGLHGKSSRGS